MTKESERKPAGDLPSGVLSEEAWAEWLGVIRTAEGDSIIIAEALIALTNDRAALLARVAELEQASYPHADRLLTHNKALQAAAALDRRAMEWALTDVSYRMDDIPLCTSCNGPEDDHDPNCWVAILQARLDAHAEG